MITLYELAGADEACRFSPAVWRVRMALRHKGLAFEGRPWRFMEKEAIAPSGGGTVPVIVDQGRWVRDGLAIAEYLEATYPDHPSLFGGEQGLALGRFMVAWVDRTLAFPVARLILTDIFARLAEGDKAYFRQSREKRFGCRLEEVCQSPAAELAGIRGLLEPARRLAAVQPFLAGSAPGFADYALYGTFMWARMVSDRLTLADDDPLAPWLTRLDSLHEAEGARALAAAGMAA
ncbi:MAG: glutathione S-transferase N-terminal domain-containing protein [Acetobacteraceae bacterium]|nr:glutathione S-transferase N-terminal domain-containing protein [Acetobacteraceae bacterium]